MLQMRKTDSEQVFPTDLELGSGRAKHRTWCPLLLSGLDTESGWPLATTMSALLEHSYAMVLSLNSSLLSLCPELAESISVVKCLDNSILGVTGSFF